MVFIGQRHSCFGTVHALDHLPDLLFRLIERLPLTEQIPAIVIPAVGTRAGYDQVANTGKSKKGFRLTTQFDPQTADLCDPSRHERGLCIVSHPHSFQNTSGERDDIFQCPTNLNSNNIRTYIHTEILTHKYILNKNSRLFRLCPNYNCSWNMFRNLLCMARAGKNCYVCLR